MNTPGFEELLFDAEDPFFEKYPPSQFLKIMGFTKSSKEFCLAAWELFKLERKRISKIEVLEYLKRQREVDLIIKNNRILPEERLFH